MSKEEKGDSSQGKNTPSTGVEPKVKSVLVKKPQSFGERPLTAIEMAPRTLRHTWNLEVYNKNWQVLEKNGERGRNRTFNLLIKSSVAKLAATWNKMQLRQ